LQCVPLAFAFLSAAGLICNKVNPRIACSLSLRPTERALTRPRKYPDGTTASERARLSQASRGVIPKRFEFSPDTIRTLGVIKAATGEPTVAILKRLIAAERARIEAE